MPKLTVLPLICLWAFAMVIGTGLPGTVSLAQSSGSKQTGVLKMYKKASQLFQQSRFDDAISAFTIILRSYPSHEPSRIHIAKSYYRLGKIDQAAKIFSQLVVENFDPETAYEYGQTFLKKKKYEKALRGFQIVPSGHALFDLSSYYGGVCAIKTKDYQLGLTLMEQAVVLPSKLIKSKRNYQRFAQSKLLEIQERKEAARREKERERERERQKLAKSKRNDRRSSQQRQQAPTVEIEGFLLTDNKAGIFAQHLSQSQDFSGDSQAEAERTEFGVFAQYGKDFYFGSKSKRSHFHSNLSVQSSQLQLKDNVRDILASPRETFRGEIINTTQAKSFSDVAVAMGPEWNIGNNTWLGLKGEYLLFLPDNDSKLQSSLPNFTLSLGQKNPKYWILLKVDYHIQNYFEARRLEQTSEHLSLNLQVNQRLRVLASADLSQFNYVITETDGPDWYNRLGIRATYDFTKNLKLSLDGYYEQVQGNRRNDIIEATEPGEENTDADFSHQNLAGIATIEVLFSNWLSISLHVAGYDREVQEIKPDNPEELRKAVKTALRDEFPTFLTDFYGNITASYSF
ncbi:MAG: tetratricopeptide repeat protein [Pseudobacteriovorax sp.]|nr:tetratricopeptide repeat protein [Pseudobacteriovorax sp.]